MMPISFAGKSVLIVEDNEALAYIFSEYMEDLGVAADFARNGKDACEMAALKKYDFILMDIYMPVMSGVEATSKILSLSPRAIIIAISSSSERLEYERMKAAGAKDCIVKPVSKEKLIKTLGKNLELVLT
jgi:two-component system, sensor histidine kinase